MRITNFADCVAGDSWKLSLGVHHLEILIKVPLDLVLCERECWMRYIGCNLISCGPARSRAAVCDTSCKAHVCSIFHRGELAGETTPKKWYYLLHHL